MQESTTEDAVAGLPRPSATQLAWQEQEIGMFFHFDIATYAPGWDWRSWKDLPDPDQYQPTHLDTDQWMEAAKAIGARYAIFVAKHCSGFLQWQSDVYPYGVRQSSWRGGKGDVVADFIQSCHKYGIRPGLYASVSANGYLGVDNPGLINHGRGGDAAEQARYATLCEQMLTELWSRYGELAEIWFDGGALPPAEGGPDLVPLLKRLQPQASVFQGPVATIRWVGNEDGVADYPCWATYPSLSQAAGDDAAERRLLAQGDPNGTLWLPGECDVPVRNHEWFWKPNQDHTLYSVEELMTMYCRSVGRNCNLLLNANPGPDGLVPAADFQRYVEFGKEIRRRFEKPLAETGGEGEVVELALAQPAKIDQAILMEEIAGGERVREYVLEGRQAGTGWRPLCAGSCIGHKRIERFAATTVEQVRLRCTRAAATPRIRSLAVYTADAAPA